ncbi:spermidine/putrescine ABC transporter periplasmic substrate-binding protein [Variovorax sp. SRS16]|uniref:ABC transporter substrate-binding protein n=1 Tax=Variovorax sp. SRS16 TaxID=282217 RepID=UPI0013175F7A|nr:ABC transporter substrate-binding protein [Variovorax sp. SRS16]VTU14975.1 spermidine/putrescine ABC transporter periplasmic substrate-binding protein [Variovorax sp. SRS16]
MRITLKNIGTTAALLGALFVFPAHAQKTVTVAGWGGESQEAVVKGLLGASRAMDIEVRQDRHGGLAGLKANVSSGRTTWDLVDMGFSRCEQAAAGGLLEKLDYKVIHAGGLNPDYVRPDYVGVFSFSYGIAYNTRKYAQPPTGWKDFWDVKRFPGKRALFNQGPYVLEAALMADGVAPADVYRILSTPAGVDRAFKKLEEIKPDVAVWWNSSGQAMQLIRDGEVDMIMLANGRAGALMDDGAKVGFSFDQALLEIECLMVPKGAPNAASAMQLINAALDPQAQARAAMIVEYGPTNLKAFDTGAITPARMAKLPTAPQHLSKQLLTSPEWYASAQGIAAMERFARFLQR